MRLVSVVVPLWLTATTRVSRRSARHAEARELGGGRGLDPEARPGGQAGQDARPGSGRRRRRCPGRSRGPGRSRPWRSRSATTGGQRPLAEVGVEQAVALGDAAPQRLAEAGRRLGDLLEEEVRVASPRSMSRVVISAPCTSSAVERQLGAVVGQPADARRASPAWRRRARTTWPRLPGWSARAASRRRCAGSAASPRRGRRARWPRRRRPRRGRRRAPGRCPAGPAAPGRAGSAATAPMATEPSNDGDRAPEGLGQVARAPSLARDERGDDLGVGGDRRPGCAGRARPSGRRGCRRRR